MRTSIWTRLLITALAGCTMVALAAPAIGQGDQTRLRRDGSKAVPLVADVDAQSGSALRRDGSQAEPFAADVGGPAVASDDGFDWGDAGIGAGTGALLVLAAGAVTIGALRRPSRSSRGPSAETGLSASAT